NLRHRAVAVVSQGIDQDGDTARSVAFIGDLEQLGVVTAAGGTLDGALDVVGRHVVVARLLYCQAQPEVHLRVGPALLGGDRDLARQLGEQRTASNVGDALLPLDLRPLGMAGHDEPSALSYQPSALTSPAGRQVSPTRERAPAAGWDNLTANG